MNKTIAPAYHFLRRLFARCNCRWKTADILGLDTAERVPNNTCRRHGSQR